MMSIRCFGLLAAVCLSTLAACTTIVSGGKADAKSEGKRYALPLPILEVIPNPDGTIAVQPKYLPDPNNEYTVSAVSLMSKYTFDVQTKDGLLQSASMDADATGVAKEALSAGGEVGAAKFAADAKAAEAKTKAAGDSAKNIADKKLALAQAKKKLAEMLKINADPATKGVYSPKDIAEAELAVVAAETAYEAAQGQITVDTGGNLDTGEGGAVPPTLKMAWGPVYYQVVQTIEDGEPTVTLRATSWDGPSSDPSSIGQKQFWTSTTGKAATPAPSNLDFAMVGSAVVRPKNGKLVFKVQATNGTFTKVLAENASVAGDLDPTPRPVSVAGQPDGKTVVVDLPSNLPSGKYTLHFSYKQDDNAKIAEVAFSVQR